MTEASPASQAQIRAARDVLAAFGVGDGQRRDWPALALLALAHLNPGQSWDEASAPLMRVLDIMRWANANYGAPDRSAYGNVDRRYRESLADFLAAGLIVDNRADPSRPINNVGGYRLRDDVLNILRRYGEAEFGSVVRSYTDSIIASQASGRDLANARDLPALLSGLVESTVGLRAAEAAVIQGRRRVLAELRALAARPGATETTMQEVLQNHHWIFGGQYIAISPRRDLVPMQQHDILLVAANKSLTIVELKGPHDPLLARPRENHRTVSAAVNEAVGQSMNYLRSMDEFSLSLVARTSNDLGLDYDFRRADAIVIIGNQDRPGKVATDRAQTDQVLRMYNSHLSRIKVLTYADLLDTAERALQFEA